MAQVEELEPTGVAPFDEAECGHHMPCPEWLVEQEAVGEGGAPEEPELDLQHHLHDLWATLGLGEV